MFDCKAYPDLLLQFLLESAVLEDVLVAVHSTYRASTSSSSRTPATFHTCQDPNVHTPRSKLAHAHQCCRERNFVHKPFAMEHTAPKLSMKCRNTIVQAAPPHSCTSTSNSNALLTLCMVNQLYHRLPLQPAAPARHKFKSSVRQMTSATRQTSAIAQMLLLGPMLKNTARIFQVTIYLVCF